MTEGGSAEPLQGAGARTPAGPWGGCSGNLPGPEGPRPDWVPTWDGQATARPLKGTCISQKSRMLRLIWGMSAVDAMSRVMSAVCAAGLRGGGGWRETERMGLGAQPSVPPPPAECWAPPRPGSLPPPPFPAPALLWPHRPPHPPPGGTNLSQCPRPHSRGRDRIGCPCPCPWGPPAARALLWSMLRFAPPPPRCPGLSEGQGFEVVCVCGGQAPGTSGPWSRRVVGERF